MKRSRRAFSLLELLVVMLILVVPAAILLPVFAQARFRAKIAPDISNLRQIGQARAIYEADAPFPKNLPTKRALVEAGILDPRLCASPLDPTVIGNANKMRSTQSDSDGKVYPGWETPYKDSYWELADQCPQEDDCAGSPISRVDQSKGGGWLLSRIEQDPNGGFIFQKDGEPYFRLLASGAVVLRRISFACKTGRGRSFGNTFSLFLDDRTLYPCE